jgi:hypothetical protein
MRGYTIYADGTLAVDAGTLAAACGRAKDLAAREPGVKYEVQRNDGRVLEATYQIVKGVMRAVIR